jgi:hypothetical protein
VSGWQIESITPREGVPECSRRHDDVASPTGSGRCGCRCAHEADP